MEKNETSLLFKNKLKVVCRPEGKNKKFNLPGESRTASQMLILR